MSMNNVYVFSMLNILRMIMDDDDYWHDVVDFFRWVNDVNIEEKVIRLFADNINCI